jgi:hypothetical protein
VANKPGDPWQLACCVGRARGHAGERIAHDYLSIKVPIIRDRPISPASPGKTVTAATTRRSRFLARRSTAYS